MKTVFSQGGFVHLKFKYTFMHLAIDQLVPVYFFSLSVHLYK